MHYHRQEASRKRCLCPHHPLVTRPHPPAAIASSVGAQDPVHRQRHVKRQWAWARWLQPLSILPSDELLSIASFSLLHQGEERRGERREERGERRRRGERGERREERGERRRREEDCWKSLPNNLITQKGRSHADGGRGQQNARHPRHPFPKHSAVRSHRSSFLSFRHPQQLLLISTKGHVKIWISLMPDGQHFGTQIDCCRFSHNDFDAVGGATQFPTKTTTWRQSGRACDRGTQEIFDGRVLSGIES